MLLLLKISKFYRGDWTNEEDIEIVDYVYQQGTKWSKLAKIFKENRTEHNLKNRFFSILGRVLNIATKKIKKNVNYRSKSILTKVLKTLKEN